MNAGSGNDKGDEGQQQGGRAPVAKPKPVRYRLPGDRDFQEEAGKAEDSTERSDLRQHLLGSMQMQHLLVLAGSGTSLGAGYPSMWKLWEGARKIATFDATSSRVNYPGPEQNPNIEELLSRCDACLQLGPDNDVDRFKREALDLILNACGAPPDPTKLEPQKTLLRKLARRRARDPRLKLFTTNYDRCFEVAASALGMIPIDGFSFTTPREFDPRFFQYDIVRRTGGSDGPAFVQGVFQYLKLHGSADWSTRHRYTTVRENPTADEACIVYPARSKFQKSFEQPQLELMAQYLAALREANTCLIVLGFGFNDVHLAEPIIGALERNPHFRLVVVDPSAETQLKSEHPQWSRLNDLSAHADVAFVAAMFHDFVELLPDLIALSPADELAQAVRRVTQP